MWICIIISQKILNNQNLGINLYKCLYKLNVKSIMYFGGFDFSVLLYRHLTLDFKINNILLESYFNLLPI